MTPEAMRRLADLQLEREFGIAGGDKAGGTLGRAGGARRRGRAERDRRRGGAPTTIADAIAAAESDEEFERRTTGEALLEPAATFDLP